MIERDEVAESPNSDVELQARDGYRAGSLQPSPL